jgi:hypothetical protein
MELLSMRLAMRMPFEKGIKQLWTKVEEVKAMNTMVISGLPEEEVEERKKEILYCFLQDNSDTELIKDFRNFQYTCNSMFDQCITCKHDLDVPRAASAGRGRDTAHLAAVGDGGEHPPERALRATTQEKVQALEQRFPDKACC